MCFHAYIEILPYFHKCWQIWENTCLTLRYFKNSHIWDFATITDKSPKQLHLWPRCHMWCHILSKFSTAWFISVFLAEKVGKKRQLDTLLSVHKSSHPCNVDFCWQKTDSRLINMIYFSVFLQLCWYLCRSKQLRCWFISQFFCNQNMTEIQKYNLYALSSHSLPVSLLVLPQPWCGSFEALHYSL